MARVEGILEEMRTRMTRLEDEVAQLRREMQANFRWTIGIMLAILIPMWVTIILAILLH